MRSAPWTDPLIDSPRDHDDPGRYRLTSRHVEVDGVARIPISGELHFSRLPRRRWVGRLRQMRAGGLTVVACYVFWNHHAEHGPEASFADHLDLAAFVDACDEVGLDVVLRLGPWCHGEVRHGGLPDWVIEQCPRTRTDDPTYLQLVEDWFAALAGQLAGRLGPGSRVVGLQVENELYDDPDHLRTLKRLAVSCGLTAPVWTATAWGGADLPAGEVLPLHGGYSDGFWVDADEGWGDSFRKHFFISHSWDDSGIGADVRSMSGQSEAQLRPPPPEYPIATCELAGGMATAYHRRPWPHHLDVAAVAHGKLGSGSAWQGYYMYAGGANPASRSGLQESHATGYPNDLERLNYDFHAPIGMAGTLRTSHAELRLQHAFVASFADVLTGSPSSLPDEVPDSVADTDTLRWAWRGTDDGGFVFVNWHQPHEPLADYQHARFTVVTDRRRITFPPRPITIPAGTLAHWPVGLTIGGVGLRWATASAVTVLPATPRRPPTLVLLAERGIDAQLAVDGDSDSPEQVHHLDRAAETPRRIDQDGAALDVLALPDTARHELWVLPTADGSELWRSSADLVVDDAHRVVVRSSVAAPRVARFATDTGIWETPELQHRSGTPSVVPALVGPPHPPDASPPAGYGRHQNRASAPDGDDIARLAHRFPVTLPADHRPGQDATLAIDWSGDVAVVVVDGQVVADRFWDGSIWELDVVDLGIGSGFEIWIVPLRADAEVHLPSAAQRQREADRDDLVHLDAVTVRSYGTWLVRPGAEDATA